MMTCQVTLCSMHAILQPDCKTKKPQSITKLGCLSNLCVPACNYQNQLMCGYQTPTLCRFFSEKEEVLNFHRDISFDRRWGLGIDDQVKKVALTLDLRAFNELGCRMKWTGETFPFLALNRAKVNGLRIYCFFTCYHGRFLPRAHL